MRKASYFGAMTLFAASFFVTGCNSPVTGGDSSATIGLASGVAIDLSGNAWFTGYTGTSSGQWPCVWENSSSEPTSLYIPYDTYFVTGQVFVDSSNNSYVTGSEGTSPSTLLPCYWKNGNLFQLLPGTNTSYGTNTYGGAVGAVVDGLNHLYIAGFVGSSDSSCTPCYWVDGGAPIALPLTSGNTYGWANSVAVSGTNVYIVGAEGTSSSAEKPCYWIVGGSTATDLGSSAFGVARGITSSGGTLYISGTQGPSSSAVTPCYWSISGSTTLLSLGTNTYGWAAGIGAISGSIYVAGVQGSSSSDLSPAYWINGASANDLPLGSGNTHFGLGWSATDSANFYTAGTVGASSSTPVACYWKNGSQYLLPLVSALGSEVWIKAKGQGEKAGHWAGDKQKAGGP